MENKNHMKKVLCLIIAFCVVLSVYAKNNVGKQIKVKAKTEIPGKIPGHNKDSVVVCPGDTVTDPQERALSLLKDKILLAYLYDNRCDNNTKLARRNALVPEWCHSTGDKRCESVINYGVLSADKGTEDAEMFWSIIKDAVFNKKTDMPGKSVAVTDLDRHHVLGDTIVSSYVDKDLCTMIITYIFGGKYIDFDNEYVAKHAEEIRQICAEIRYIKSQHVTNEVNQK